MAKSFIVFLLLYSFGVFADDIQFPYVAKATTPGDSSEYATLEAALECIRSGGVVL